MERRLAAILVADMVGYSRLMEQDEEGTLSTLKTYREDIDRRVNNHQGRMFANTGFGGGWLGRDCCPTDGESGVRYP